MLSSHLLRHCYRRSALSLPSRSFSRGSLTDLLNKYKVSKKRSLDANDTDSREDSASVNNSKLRAILGNTVKASFQKSDAFQRRHGRGQNGSTHLQHKDNVKDSDNLAMKSRKNESKRNEDPPTPNHSTKRVVQRGRVNTKPEKTIPDAVPNKIPDAVPAAAASASPDTIPEAISDDSDVDLDAEAAYQQKQIHLKKKREKMNRDLYVEEDTMPKYVKNFDEDIIPDEVETKDPLLKSKSPQTVAEMKALAEERLASKKENPVASTWVDYKGMRRKKRHERMNEIKEKNKIRKEKKWGKKQVSNVGTIIHEIKIPHNGLTIRELSQRLSMKIADTMQRLNDIGENVDRDMEDIENLLVDPDVIELLAMDMNLEVVRQEAISRDPSEYIKKANRSQSDADLVPRSPIISVMGHVDHGKTTLLDRLREASTAASEAGGITQKLSAFNIAMGGRRAVFLDTPGHAAFSGMRKSGAAGSDMVVLVVAIEDGVRPLTIEAAKVAKKSGCTVVVALTKVDKLDVRDREEARRRALTGLMEVDIVAEEFGGDVQVVEVSGKTGEGVDDLIETLLLQSDVMELKASLTGGAEGVVLDAKIEKGRGVMVDVLVKWGTLKVGSTVVVSNAFGKVKAMLDDKGKSIKSAGPSTPIRLLGLNATPPAGQDLIGVESEQKARKIAERRQRIEDARRIKELNRRAEAIEAAEDPIIVPVILKADSAGSLNALRTITDALSERTDDVIIHIIASSIGDVTPSDMALAKQAKEGPPATILGFNISEPNTAIRTSAKQSDVIISTNSVIYRLEETLEDVMKSHMPMERVLTLEGVANVLQLFDYKVTSKKIRKVAGVDVVSGAMRNTSHHFFRVLRGDDVLLLESTGGQLKRFKDTVHEVKAGFECGLSIDDFEQFKEGDRIECYKFEKVAKELVVHSNKSVRYAPLNQSEADEDAEKDVEEE